jgi:elongation factor P
MLGLSDIKSGINIVLEGAPFAVLYHEHSKTGRAGSVLRTRIKNLVTGAVLEKTFQGSDQVEEADVTKGKAQFLYKESAGYAFMDNASYEQFSLTAEALGDAVNYLIEGTEVQVFYFNSNPINIELPIKMNLRVVEAPPGIKGNTVSTGGKMVTLETGLKISTPLFVNEGDVIIVNTERGEYVGRSQD